MPFDDSLIGSNDFDPRTASESLIQDLEGPRTPITTDPRALNTRLARKLNERPTNRRPAVELDDEPAGVPQSELDFSGQAAPPPPEPTIDTGLDFSAQAAPADAPVVPPPTPNGFGTYAAEFGKGVAEGAKNMPAAALKGVAGVHIPTMADPTLLDDLAAAPTMTPAQRAQITGKALKGISDKGLQIDYAAALARVAQGADAAAEIAALKPKFDLNNKAATTPVTESPIYQAGQAIEDYGKETLKAKPGFEGSWTRDIGAGAGSMLAGIPLSMIPGVGPAAAGALYTTAGMGEAVDNAVKGGATPEQTRLAARFGGVAGATDMVDTLLPSLGTTGKVLGFVKRVGLAAVKGALMEGGQEGLQQLMQNAIAKGIYKPDQDLFEDVPRSVAIAAILGGVVGGGGAAVSGGSKPQPQNSPSPAPGPGAPGGALPGPAPASPGGGPTQQSSPEDIADFVRQAQAQNPPQPGPAPRPVNPANMSDADLADAFTEARASMGDKSLDEILRAGGYAPDTIKHMDERGKVEEAIGIANAYKAEATQKAAGATEAPKPEAAPKASDQPSHQEYAVLREYGYSDEDIGNMPKRQRAREVIDAQSEGIDPAKAMQKHALPETFKATGAPVDRAGAAGTRQAKQPLNEPLNDTGKNTPETPATLKAQQDQLVRGERAVQMFPAGTREMSVPAGMQRIITPRGTFHYNPQKITPQQITEASAAGRENELLGLGSFSKADVAGADQVTIVERTADGTEVRSAVGNKATAEQQRAEMEKGKSPGHTVAIETVEGVLDGRRGSGTREQPIEIKSAHDVEAIGKAASGEYTHAQGEANNRQLGHGKWNGMPVSMEVAKGGTRKMVNPETGEDVSVAHAGAAYGYFPGTVGADGMHVDLYLGDHPESPHVYVIDEVDRGTKKFRQHKVMGGFTSERDAFVAYTQTSTKGPETVGAITAMSVPELKEWLDSGDTTKALAKTPEPSSSAKDQEGSARRGSEPAADNDGSKGSPAEDAKEATTGPGITMPNLPESSVRNRTYKDNKYVIEGEVLSPSKLFAEPTARHHQQIEAALGVDYDHVMAVDIQRAAEIMAENETMPAEVAFGHAVIENAVEQGFLTEQQAEQVYGPQVQGVLEAGREAASGGSSDVEQGGAASEQERAGGATEAGVVSRGGEDGAQGEPAKPETTAIADEGVQHNERDDAAGGKPDTKRDTGDRAAEKPAAAAEAADHATVEGFLDEVEEAIAVGRYDAEIAPTTDTLEFKAAATERGWTDSAYGKGKALWSPDRKHVMFVTVPVQGNHLNVQWGKPADGISGPPVFEKKERLEDAGEKIGGARKDAWGANGLSYADLDGMTEIERIAAVNKQAIFARPDYSAMVDGGVDPLAAAMVKRIYDRLPTKPNTGNYGRDDDTAVKNYIDGLKKVRDFLRAVRTPSDAKNVNNKVDAAIEWQKKGVLYPLKSTVNPFYISRQDERAAEKAVAAGFPNMAPWTRLFEVREETVWPTTPQKKAFSDYRDEAAKLFEQAGVSLDLASGGLNHAGFITLREWKGTKAVEPDSLPAELKDVYLRLLELRDAASMGKEWVVRRKNGGKSGEGYKTQEEAQEAAKAAYDNLEDDRKTGGEEPKRPHLDKVARSGPDYRGGRDVTGEDFVKDFGFRGVEFGNYVASDERQKTVNLAYDALQDLARIMKVPAKAISLDGTLSLGFGSRGHGGRAAAHYEPGRMVMNMTKVNGAGSLAHEFGHALDHYLGNLGGSFSQQGVRNVSGWDKSPREGAHRTRDYLDVNSRLPMKLRAAVNRLMNDLFQVQEDSAEAERRITVQIEEANKALANWQEHRRKIIARKAKGESGKGLSQADDGIQWWQDKLRRLEKQRERGEQIWRVSDYAKQATALGEYWSRPNELFARAFETYVFDRIADEGFESQYLVQGVEPNRFGNGFKGNPYPAGEERTRINADFDRIVRAVQVAEGKLGAETKIEGAPGPVEEVVKVAKPTPQPTAKAEAAAVMASSQTLDGAFEQHFADGKGFAGILEARKFAKEAGFDLDPKAIEEAIELSIVRTARKIINGNVWRGPASKMAYETLVNLYGRQPRLGTRTSTSVRDQAYSTPVPLAYLAQRLAGIDHGTTVYEPTAGNGALLTAAEPDKVLANEINPVRAGNLRAQGFKPMSRDATEPGTSIAKSMDVVIANPPFGPVKENGESKVFDLRPETGVNYRTSEIDHAIAMKALSAMKDDGKAVLILGGVNKLVSTEQGRADAYQGKAKREFFKALYDNYNVVDIFTVSGDLYERQGAGWPVDVVVIHGRGKSSLPLPAVQSPRIYNDWDSLGGLINGQQANRDVQPAGDAAGVDVDTGGGRLEGLGGTGGGSAGPVDAGLQQPEGVRGQPGAETDQAGAGSGEPRNGAKGLGQRERPAGTGGQSPLGDFDALFNAALDDAFGEETAAKVAKPAKVRAKRTTAKVAKDAATGTIDAADEAFTALHKLFGGNKASSGFTFDEDTYKKAKPHFEAAANKFTEVKNDLGELLKRMVGHLRDALAFTREAMQRIAPYLKRFITEMQDEAAAPERKKAIRAAPTETENQVVYKPRSNVNGLDTLAPVNMAKPMADSLAKLEQRVGQIDTFVAQELGYTPAQLTKYFGAEQVDALGLAIDNIKRGRGFIIGDQTGIGKGRVNAAIIRWAIKNDRMPVFITEKPNLYKDMFRDLMDIGISDGFLDNKPRVLATNADLKLPLEEGNGAAITTADAKKHNAHLMAVLPEIRKHYDMVFTTYNQMQTQEGKDTARRQFLSALADRPNGIVMIIDEAHNAGGQKASGRGKGAGEATGRAGFSRQLIQKANGVFYSSATYAKRPDVMDLYAATDMSMAVDDIADLAEAIQRGGIPMQQAVASMLAKAGQYVRRERSFAGINYNTPLIPVDRETYDRISHALAAIQDLSGHAKKGAARIGEQLRAEGQAMGYDGATGEAGASSTNFTSVMHNVINQMLLAMKADRAADLAIEAIKRGEKPVLTVANTMEAFLEDYVDTLGIKPGEEMPGDFSHVLKKYLDRTRTILIKKPYAEKGDKPIRHFLTDAELGPEGLRVYDKAKGLIEGADLSGMPISPIDYMKGKLKLAGYDTGEVTGRTLAVDYTGEIPVLTSRPGVEKTPRGRTKTIEQFNTRPARGGVHALIINQAGSTGLSAHASEHFNDQAKRRMLVVQPEGNIDTHMQLLGRVNRTGQVVLPEYDQLVADIPAEKRPAAVLAKKMASLNANTTASRSSAVTAKDVPDFINQYGDDIAAGWVRDNFEDHFRMASPVSISDEGKIDNVDAMRKLTGRLPLLPLEKQEAIYNQLESEYAALIEQLEASGENALEAKSYDLKAQLVERMEVQGKRNDSGSPFAAPVIMQKVSIARLGKPFKPHEILTKVAQALDPEVGATSENAPLADLAKMLAEYNNPYGILGKKSAAREREERTEALKRFAAYTRPILDDAENPEAQAKELTKFNATKDRWTTVHAMVPIGRRVVIKTDTNNLTGIVTDVKQQGEPKNPLALGSWKVTFAIADASRTMTLPFSRIYGNGQSNPDSMLDVEIEPMTDYYERPETTLERYQHMQNEARENRYIAGGNILSAFDWLEHKGAIINFTDYKGGVHQGVLTARGFDVQKHSLSHGAAVKDPAAVKKLLDDTPGERLWAKNGNIGLQKEGRYGDDYMVSAQKAKNKGGVYYLDAELTKLTGDFTSRGGMMVAYVRGASLNAAIARMQKLGAEFKGAAGSLKVEKAPSPGEDNGEGPTLASLDSVMDEENPAAAEAHERAENDRLLELAVVLNDLVRKIVGPNVGLDFTEGLIDMGGTPPGYGGSAGNLARGAYTPTRALIDLALLDAKRSGSAAFHEAYHAIEDRLQTDQERELMKRETPRLREWIKGKTTIGMTDAQVDALSGYEVRAMAFEAYGMNKASGAGLHVGVRRWFDRLLDLLRKIANAIRGLGFQSAEDIFGKAIAGEFAQRPMSASKLDHTSLAATNGMRGSAPSAPETISAVLADRGNARLAKLSNKLGVGQINATEARVKLQDKFIRIRNAEESVGNVNTVLSTYQAESLYYGRTGERLERLEKDRFDPLIKAMHAADISAGELNAYLYARHAPERNAYIDAINPAMNGEGSGMSDSVAQDIMTHLGARQPDFERVAALVDQIIGETTDNLVAYGLISQDMADSWRARWPNYVPLRGFADGMDEDTKRDGAGLGFDQRAKVSKQAYGRQSEADGPLQYVMMQAESAIVRGEKNRVGNTFLRFVRAHPNPDRWQVNMPTLKRRISKKTGEVEWYADHNYHNDPDAFVTRVGGKPVVIRLHGKDGANIARALKGMGSSNMNGLLKALHTLTTLQARMNTQYNPNFVIPNLIRDVGEALINLQAQDQQRFVTQFGKHLLPAMKGSFNVLRGSAAAGRYEQAFREYDRAGGRIRFFGLDDPDDIKRSIKRKMRALEGGGFNNMMTMAGAIGDAMEVMTGSLENATRLAAYMSARDVGMSIADSAMLARNVTVDFNKRGEWGQAINATYMFANASVQGTARMGQAMQHKNVRRAVYALAAMGAVGALYNILAGGDDDDGEPYYTKIKPWIRDKNLIIMWPKGLGHDGKYIKIPLPYGFAPFHVLGDRAMAVALGKDRVTAAAGAVLSSAAGAFNPVGEESSIWTSLVPSLLRPGMHIATNMNWTGNKLYPERDWEKGRPDSQQFFASNSAFSKWAAEGLNSLTGGSKYKAGWLDVHPGSIDHTLNAITGGLGTFVMDVVKTGSTALKGEPFDETRAPIIKRFMGSAKDPQTDAAAYYEAREEARKTGGQNLKAARKDSRSGSNKEEAESFVRDNPTAMRSDEIFKRADQAMKPLREQRARIEGDSSLSADQKRERLDPITERMRQIQNTARKRYKELKAGQ